MFLIEQVQHKQNVMENITDQVKREIDELMCRKTVGLVEKRILKKDT